MTDRPNFWLCSRCRGWFIFPPPSPVEQMIPWLCLECLRLPGADTPIVAAVAWRILQLAGVLQE